MPTPSSTDYLNLSQAVYTTGGATPPLTVALSDGTWTRIAFTAQTSNGMQAAAYRNSAGVIVLR